MRTREQEQALFNAMRVTEIMAALKVGRQQVLELIKAGKLEAIDVSVGARPEYRVSKESFQKFLQDRKVKPVAA